MTNSSNDSVTVYSRTACGNTAPRRTLSGPATELSFPEGLAVDTVNNEIVVANLDSITVYSRDASGDTAPVRKISGSSTDLAQPVGIAVDLVNHEVLVTNTDSITVYSRTASGNVGRCGPSKEMTLSWSIPLASRWTR